MRDKLLNLIIELCEIEVDENRKDSIVDLLDDLGYDSIGIVELTVEIENHFGICFDDDDLDINKLRKVDSIIEIIEKNSRPKER